MIDIRPENSEDYDQVRHIKNLAFRQPIEVKIVDTLREYDSDYMSLVALLNNQIVGHIFSVR